MAPLLSRSVFSVQAHVSGVVDLRASYLQSTKSYADGGYGKFGLSDGSQLSLSQLGSEVILSWDSGLSAHLVANAYVNKEYSGAGLTEGFIKYKTLPNEQGYRWQNRSGMFYPNISLENNAIAWASKYTLNSSMINNWIGEEIRVLGTEFSFTRLGKFNQSNVDHIVSVTAFVNNDPAGSLLAWHGWAVGNQQTLWTQTKEIAYFPAHQLGGELAFQAQNSDPFLEIDNRVGYHIAYQLKRHKKGHVSAGFYNNNGTPYVVKNGQYSWRTRFAHVQGIFNVDKTLQISAQVLKGDTLMQHPHRKDAVNNDYYSAYIAVTKRWQRHRLTGRIESFSVTDNDETIGDNNNENGQSATLSYQYRLSKGWFLNAEYNVVGSTRAARQYVGEKEKLIEQQWQLGARYFFVQ